MHLVFIELKPYFKNEPPHCKIKINGNVVHDAKLSKIINISEKVYSNDLKITIERSGRTKKIALEDPNNQITISHCKINNVNIDPSIGFYRIENNDFVKNHTVRTEILNLNGTYTLEIPYLTLLGESSVIPPYGKYSDIVFFGASMSEWNFAKGKPPLNGQNYVDKVKKHLKNLSISNMSRSAQSNQEIFDSVKKYFSKNNKAKVIFVQLVNTVARQIKNEKTKKNSRYTIHDRSAMTEDYKDEFTNMTPKTITNCFVRLNTIPILALQIPEYQNLINLAKKHGCKLFFISYFREEHKIIEEIFPNNTAPYFDIDPDDPYVQANGYHATVEEQSTYGTKILNFYQNL